MDSPNVILGSRIINRLVKEGLLRPEEAAEALQKIASGTLSGDGWRQFIGNAEKGDKVT